MSTMNITKIDTELKKLQLQMSHSIKKTKTYISNLGDLIATLDDHKSNKKTTKKSSKSPVSLHLPSTTITNQPWSLQETIPYTNKITSPSNIFSPSVEYSAYASDNSDSDYNSSSSFDLYQLSEDMVDNNILNDYGYEIQSKITNTTNGRIYIGKQVQITSHNRVQNQKRNRINLPPSPLIKANYNMLFGASNMKQLVIKKYDKDNEINFCIKEAKILHYLTVLNHPPSNNICKYFDFIETDDAYYLIEEYCGSMTLDTFISTAHKYIKDKKLKVKHWRVIVKYLFWQLIVNLNWMHSDMKCVHLDLNDATNIMIENANFNEDKKTGLITIDTKNLCVKLLDFGQSELYSLNTDSEWMLCNKHEYTTNYMYKCPEQVKGNVFNGIKADMYALGMILYKMFTGDLPYKYADVSDDAYDALENNRFREYILRNKLLKGINKNAMNLMVGLLNFDAVKRMETLNVIKNSWFTNYYIRYKYRIQQKSKSQKKRHNFQKHRYKLPYYSL